MSTAVVEAAPKGGYRKTAARPKSHDASRLLRNLVDAPIHQRRAFMRELPQRDLTALLAICEKEMGTPYGIWQDDPLGFVEDVLGERTWSRPRKILAAIPTHDRIAVPSAFSTGKTWSVSRAVLWHSMVYPVGTARVVTIASKFAQVSSIIWPEIRTAHKRAGLPGHCDVTQMKMPNGDGEYTVAEGIGAPPHKEEAVQGLHAPHLLLIVDEAGGISMPVGRNLRALLTAEGTGMVAIGNPPTDNEGSWFEVLCAEDDVLVIPISALDTPNLTGEKTDRCRSCPPQVPPHRLAKHLASVKAVNETIALNGKDSNYVQAKVLARFPRGGPGRVLPSSWLDNALDESGYEPMEGDVRICDLGLEGETEEHFVTPGAWIRLGVDVASDGGDEMVVARMVGDSGNAGVISVQHTSSGATNTNVNDVAGKILTEILRAEKLAEAIGTTLPVRVKVDAIGLGWGVVGVLEGWGAEGRHHAQIVAVDVSEGTYRQNESATLKPANKRAEMWLALRSLVQPSPAPDGLIGESAIRLRVDRQSLAQLAAPAMGSDAHGRTIVESKKSMRKRGLKSPDRAEAILLAPYEPKLKPKTTKRKAKVLV